ncbi:arginine--tRNA ligase [Candidatus Omnitrophota bacterium]
MVIKAEIENWIKQVIEQDRLLAAGIAGVPISLEAPKLNKFGDYSSNLAMLLAKELGRPPVETAQSIKKMLEAALSDSALSAKIDKIEVNGPGFINFFISKSCLYDILSEISRKTDDFGRLEIGQNKKVLVEFVSANPTGPLNVAHGRQAAFGDSLANVLEFTGFRVSREYYLNDEGTQIEILGASLRAKYLELSGQPAQFPEAGYQGKYIDDLAKAVFQRYAGKLTKDNQRNRQFFTQFALGRILKEIRQDLAGFGVQFKSWFSQKKLDRSGKITQALELLKKQDFLYEKQGAWWLATTRFGDDKDRVAIKSNGQLTYISPDIAYHQTKFQRGFSQLINIWGPDHHGYIPRIKAVINALGHDPQKLEVLIVQLVSLSSADQVIPMSTRMGQFVSLHDILQAVGKDVARFFFLMRKRDSHLNFDLELAKKQSLENPVYYIQYAHARILNIIKFAREGKKIKLKPQRKLNLSLLDKAEELALIQALRNFPAVLESCALGLEPHRITTYLQDLAKLFHYYYEKHKVVTEDLELTEARLFLVHALSIVLKNGLRLLGIGAPEQM